jgi:uncharacterized protein (TIGR02246 family)
MRRTGKLLLMGVAISGISLSAAASAQTGAVPGGGAGGKEVREVAEKYRKASLAGDAKAIAALYTDDAIEMPPNEPMIKGKANIEARYRQLMTGAKLTEFNFTHLDSQASGNFGYDVGSYSQTIKTASGEMKDTGHYTVILKKAGNDWKVSSAIYNSDRAMPPGASQTSQKPAEKPASKPKP